MTWFGKVSAWGAVVMGVAFAATTALLLPSSSVAVPILTGACSVLLLLAAFRTLRKMSGGLRLLCGIWGLVAGLSIERFFSFNDLYLWDQVAAPISIVALIGLALTVLHKETK